MFRESHDHPKKANQFDYFDSTLLKEIFQFLDGISLITSMTQVRF